MRLNEEWVQLKENRFKNMRIVPEIFIFGSTIKASMVEARTKRYVLFQMRMHVEDDTIIIDHMEAIDYMRHRGSSRDRMELLLTKTLMHSKHKHIKKVIANLDNINESAVIVLLLKSGFKLSINDNKLKFTLDVTQVCDYKGGE